MDGASRVDLEEKFGTSFIFSLRIALSAS